MLALSNTLRVYVRRYEGKIFALSTSLELIEKSDFKLYKENYKEIEEDAGKEEAKTYTFAVYQEVCHCSNITVQYIDRDVGYFCILTNQQPYGIYGVFLHDEIAIQKNNVIKVTKDQIYNKILIVY